MSIEQLGYFPQIITYKLHVHTSIPSDAAFIVLYVGVSITEVLIIGPVAFVQIRDIFLLIALRKLLYH